MSRVIRGRKIYNKNNVQNNNNNKDKGFTLVEVLAVVVIISVVIGVGFVIYNNVMNNSKEKASVMAVNNIAEAAEIYSKEYQQVKWLNSYEMSDDVNNLKVKEEYVCITVNDLVNGGYFDNDFYKSEIYKKAKITGNTYVKIVTDNDNKANYKINVLPGVTDRNKCELSDDDIKIEVKNSYTDTIEFEYKDKYESSDYSYYFKQFSDNVRKGSGTLTSGEGVLVFGGLKNNTKYVLSICSVYDGVKNCSHKDVYTEDFVDAEIDITDDNKWAQYKKVNILFSNENIKEGEARYYFKSDVDARIEHGTVYDCSSGDVPSDSCLTSVSEVKAGEWYYVSNRRIVLYIDSDLDIKGKMVYARVYDKTGNVNHVEANVKKIDTIPPMLIVTNTVNGETYDGNWTNQNIISSLTFSDSASGINASSVAWKENNGDWTPCTNTSTASYSDSWSADRNSTGYWKICDNAGNCADESFVLKIDKTEPTLTVANTVDGEVYDGDWTNQNIISSLTFSDSGSGIKTSSVAWKEDNGDWNSCDNDSTESYSDSWSAERDSTGYWKICDNLGNCTEKSFALKIDKTAPTLTVANTVNGETYDGNWTNQNIISSLTFSDSGSGIKASSVAWKEDNGDWNSCDNDSTESYSDSWSADRNSTGYWKICDNAGNCADKSFVLKIDKTAPTCTSSKSNTNSTSGVTATFTCSDGASGVVACAVQQTGLKSNGSYKIYDYAGNSGTCDVSVTSSTKWRCKDCSTCNRCASAGCSSYSSWKLPTKNAKGCYPNYYGNYSSRSACNSGKPSDTSYTQYICTDTNDYACTGGTNVFKYFKKTRTCNTYKRSCSSCKCETWSSTWTGYNYTESQAGSNTKCESAIFYS